MKVIHLSSSDLSGGASIACKRISDALILENVDSNLLVQKKISPDDKVQSTTNNFFSKLHYNLRYALDEGFIRLLTNQQRGRFSNPLIGINIADHPLIVNSSIINLHWINGGFLSLDNLKKLGKLGKPIVWTLHDMWAFTGGCHYNLDCRKFESECNYCPSLKQAGITDSANKIFREKNFFNELNLTIVTCSKWLKQEAERSALLSKKKIINIPNPLDAGFYKPLDKISTRKKLGLNEKKSYILFGAMNLKDKRKGFHYLIEALNFIHNQRNNQDIEVLVFGKLDKEILSTIPLKIIQLGKLKNENDIVAAYNSADVFVAPSIMDNLPNTIMESMSCGTPAVAFNVGGIPDMVDDNQNGILTKLKSSSELASGILRLLSDDNLREKMSVSAREKILSTFNQATIAGKYIELYRSLIKN